MNNNVVTEPRFTFFQGPIKSKVHTPCEYVTIDQVARLIGSEKYIAATNELRSLTDESAQRNYKSSHLDYVLFGGVFGKFSNDGLVMPSMYICMDFDHIADVNDLKARLMDDKYFKTQLMFCSPRGNGVKWLIDAKDEILKYGYNTTWQSIRNYALATYSLSSEQVDKNCSNIGRATFLCYDPDVYISR